MKEYKIEIPNERIRAYNLIALIIFLMNFFSFGYLFVKDDSSLAFWLCLSGMILSAIPAIYFLLNKKHINSPYLEVVFFVLAVFWLKTAAPASLAIVFSAFFGFLANKKKIIVFNKTGIAYPSVPVKKYAWSEVENVILNAGVLTIDLKNNKLLQFSLPAASLPEERSFNDAMASRIAAAEHHSAPRG